MDYGIKSTILGFTLLSNGGRSDKSVGPEIGVVASVTFLPRSIIINERTPSKNGLSGYPREVERKTSTVHILYLYL